MVEKCAIIEKIELTKAESEFREFCHKLGYGKIEVIIKDGEPVYATQIKQDTKFG